MKLLKKINNNFVLAQDSKGKTVIASGKGVGFLKMPCEINDLSRIDNVYYNVDDRYLRVLKSVPDSMLEVGRKIVDYAEKTLKMRLNQNLIFVLADHIHFALVRSQKGMTFDMGITFEISYLHPVEMEIGRKAVEFINRISKAKLPDSEAAIIAMHVIEAQPNRKEDKKDKELNDIVEDMVKIVENLFHITLSRKSFSYYRFATHIKYLLNRKIENKVITSDNQMMMEDMIEKFPEAYKCVLVIKQYCKEEMNWDIKEEEQLYLLLHINRMKEDCN